MKRFFLMLASVAFLLAVFAPATLAAEPTNGRDSVLVAVNRTVDIPAGDHLDTLLLIDGTAKISGDVTTIVIAGGSATLSGATAHSVTVFNGSADLQAGTTVSGPATLVKPSLNVPAAGTMSGTLIGSQLTLTYSVPAGGVPVFLSCTIAGSGAATATPQTISGSLQTTFTNCLGSGLETPESPQLTLARQ